MATAASRRTVTVLFCDLAGSTALGERLDPERLRTLLSRWYEAMREPVERHGGTVEKFIGDAVMAVFGVPHLHEDDALRAVRAALEMRDAAGEVDESLRVRIGVNTGEVVTGAEDATLVTGDAVNTAKRLEEAAAAGEILIGDVTRRLVENAVELEAAGPVEAKGKQRPVHAWRLLAAIPGAPAFARRLDAPLVGRGEELATLRAELASAAERRSCRLVTVLGPAGIGKSRLASELLAEARERATVLSARCVAYGDGFTFLPLVGLVRSAGGREAVEAAVAGEADGAQVVERLRGVLGEPGEPVPSEETFWAVRRLFEALARDRPLVVCLEDVHWAEPTFLDLVEYLVGWSRGAAILLLCLARPELLDERPRWGGAQVALDALSSRDAAALVEELAAEWPLPPEARRRAIAAAEGNPLFLEQLVAMLAGGETAPGRLPPTIQALLAARLDRLPPGERTLLERASVAGREFSRDAVVELSGEDDRDAIAPALLALVRQQLLAPQPSRTPGDDAFSFRHVLIRDAVYAGLAKAARADLHERYAARLERLGAPEELVGYHLEQSHRCRVELGTPRPELAERAGRLLARAGQRSAERGDAAASLTLLRRSLALLPAADPARPGLLRELSAALWLSGDVDAAELALSEALDVARAAGDARLEWYARLDRAARNATVHGDTGSLAATAERAIDVFAELGDDLGVALAWRRLGLATYTDERFGAAAAAFERALAFATACGDERERARSADALCTAWLFGPAHVDDVVRRAEEIRASARGNLVLEANVGATLAVLVAMQGDFERARGLAAEAGEIYERLGLRLPWVGWKMNVAWIERLAGETDAAVEALREAYAVLDSGGYDSHRAFYAALLALLLAGEGRRREARSYAAVCRRAADGLDHATRVRLDAAEALLARGREEATALARRAVAGAHESDDLNLQAEMHQVLARVADDPDEAAEARRLYEAKGNRTAARLAVAHG